MERINQYWWFQMSKSKKAYTTPSNLRYNTPVYIHSHETALPKIDSSLFKTAKTLHDLTRRRLDKIASYMKTYSNTATIRQFYADTHDGTKRKHSKDGQKLVNQLQEMRKILYAIKSNDGRIEYKSTAVKKAELAILAMWESDPDKSLEELFGAQLADDISKYFAGQLREDYNYKNKYMGLSGKNAKVSDLLTIRKLRDDSRRRKDNELMLKDASGRILLTEDEKSYTDVLKKQLTLYYEQNDENAGDVEATVKTFQKQLDEYLNSFKDVQEELMGVNNLEKLQSRIDKLNRHKQAALSISASGFQFEKVFNFLATEQIRKEGLDVEISGKTFKIEGSSSSSKSHGMTTDNIITLIDGMGKRIEMGFSLKTSYNTKTLGFDSTFKKTVSLNIKDPKKSFFSENQMRSILYYLGNARALSIFAAPAVYHGGVVKRDKKNGSFKVDMPPLANVNVISIENKKIEEIRSAYASIAMVKGIMGNIYTMASHKGASITETWDTYGKEKDVVPPIFLSFVNDDYWMYEVMENLSAEYKNNFSGLSEYAKKIAFTNNELKELCGSNFNKESLTHLFVLKKLISKTRRQGTARYRQLLEDEKNPYYGDWEEYRRWNTVPQLLKEITSSLTLPRLQDFFFGKIDFTIPIDKFVHR